jgi:class 3 adenylate cyclase
VDTATADLLISAREAIDRHAWTDALDLFQKADLGEQLSGADLELMAVAAFFSGKADVVIEAKERAFKTHLAAGDRVRAAYLALDVSREYFYQGKGSIASAWLRRGERLLEGEPESFAHGYLAMAHAQMARSAGDMASARQLAENAVRIGSQTGNADLEALSLIALGSIKIAAGEVTDGFGRMEEATLAALNGELSPLITGVTYCSVISACRDLADYQRAGEWTEATEKWCDKQSISGFPGVCRVHRAEIVAQSGAWERAEEELIKATRELAAYNATPPIADGFYSLAQLRYRRGDLDGAEEALKEAHRFGRHTQPVFSLIRLARGNLRTAFSSIKSARDELAADSWVTARLLPAYIEIAIAAGELAAARTGAEELTKLVESYDAMAMQAERELAWGRVLLAESEFAQAIPRLRRAHDLWSRVPAPYEAAVSRWLLSKALRALHDIDEADLELEVALNGLTMLGAKRDIEAIRNEMQAAADRRQGPASTRKTFMFTDIVGSTNLAEMLGDQAWDQLLRWHDEALRSEFSRQGGEVANSTGDGFFVAFESAKKAIECAINIQQRLRDHRISTGFAPMVRIGLHTAEANQVGSDYSGVGVHIAARVSALAGGEEIVASADTVAEAGDVSIGEAREATLKGVAKPVAVVPIIWR